jgi:hypothetical protein
MLEFKLTEPVISVPADLKTLMLVLKLAPLEAKFLQAMLEHAWVGIEEVPDLRNSKRQVVFVIRRKLDPKNILIVNDGAGKYCLPPSSKLALKRVIEDYFASHPKSDIQGEANG